MNGRGKRRKGHQFERETAIVFRAVWPDAARGIGQARAGGEVPDVDHTPYWVECKHRKRVSIGKAWAQAKEMTDGRPALAVTRENRGPILVTMAMDEFLALVSASPDSVTPALAAQGATNEGSKHADDERCVEPRSHLSEGAE